MDLFSLIFVAIILLMIFSLCGCCRGSNGESYGTTVPETVQNTPSIPPSHGNYVPQAFVSPVPYPVQPQMNVGINSSPYPNVYPPNQPFNGYPNYTQQPVTPYPSMMPQPQPASMAMPMPMPMPITDPVQAMNPPSYNDVIRVPEFHQKQAPYNPNYKE